MTTKTIFPDLTGVTLAELRKIVAETVPSTVGSEVNERGPYVSTGHGHVFYPFDPQPVDVHWEDIFESLGRQCRYNGHCDRFYSVAEHSVIMSYQHPDIEVQKWALIHDFPEAYVGDLIRPLKKLFPVYSIVEDEIMMMLAEMLDMAFIKTPTIVHNLDMQMCATEKRDLLIGSEPWHQMPDPIPGLHIPMRECLPAEATRLLRHRFNELFPGIL